MSDELAALQHDFAASLREAQGELHIARWMVGDASSVERRMAIYRANVAASIGKALTAAYPVVRRVVGEEFFDALARAYLRIAPSTSGDLGDYGESFAPFLAEFEHARSLPYLPDLARLEWAVHCAYGAEDGVSLDRAALGAIAAERQGDLRFAVAPGTAIVDSSAYPIARIWTIHQQGFDGEFSVDWSVAETALVARSGFAVTVDSVTEGEAAFVAALLRRATLGEATASAIDADAAFDLGAFLSRAIACDLLCGFTLDEEPR